MKDSSPSVPNVLPEDVQAAPLSHRHGDDLISLLRGVGWKHTREEIQLYLDSSDGRGYFDATKRLVACAFCVAYPPRFGAVGIVVVDSTCRRRGLASNLARWACERLAAKGMAALLTCREEVRPLYDQLGFKPVGRLRRVRLVAPPGGALAYPQGLHLSDNPDLADVAAYDAVQFGGDRQCLLRTLLGMDGAMMLAALDPAGAVHGYAYLRPGSDCFVLGPVVAESDEIAGALASRLMADHPGPFHIDLLDGHNELGAWLSPVGLETFIPCHVMVRLGDNPFAQQVYAVASLGFC